MMTDRLTISELTAPGRPLERAEPAAGRGGLANVVTWAVSLRPYAPAIPRLKGGEIALVSAEILARHEPPVTLADVVRQLSELGAAGLAVRGTANRQALEAAQELDFPLLRLPDDVALHEIEQEIMRECALFQARREIMASEEPGAWIGRLLTGRIATFVEAQGPARREGYAVGPAYAVALMQPAAAAEEAEHQIVRIRAGLAGRDHPRESGVIAAPFETGLVALVPPGGESALLAAIRGLGVACGLGQSQPLLDAPLSLEGARLALLSSALLHRGEPVRYADLRAERMILLLYQRDRAELAAFVQETLGPLLAHDAGSAAPLLPTVASFVEHGGRLRETAADIYVHRNTLAYRLDRASEILGADLRDSDERLAVEIALRALPLVADDVGKR